MKHTMQYVDITPTKTMITKASSLKEGDILITYYDGKCIRMETDRGKDTYVWRDEGWRRMRSSKSRELK